MTWAIDQVILFHGMPDKDEYLNPRMPSASNSHWFPYLQKQLLIKGIPAHTPEVFESWKPEYSRYRRELERYEITPKTALVGHSCGGGFLMRWLSENKDVRVGKVVLVAPWLDPDREETTDFFDFELDPDMAARTARLTIFNSDDDFASIQKSVAILRKTIANLTYREFHNYGHFCLKHLRTDEFPELLAEIST